MQIIKVLRKPFRTNLNHLKLSTLKVLNNFLTQVHKLQLALLFKYLTDFQYVDRACVKNVMQTQICRLRIL